MLSCLSWVTHVTYNGQQLHILLVYSASSNARDPLTRQSCFWKAWCDEPVYQDWKDFIIIWHLLCGASILINASHDWNWRFIERHILVWRCRTLILTDWCLTFCQVTQIYCMDVGSVFCFALCIKFVCFVFPTGVWISGMPPLRPIAPPPHLSSQASRRGQHIYHGWLTIMS